MSKNVDTISYLSPLQHGMLHHSQLAPASGVYVEQFSCVLSGALDTERFERAWAAVVQRHDVLKTLFIRLQEERPLQVVRKQVVLPLRRQDWRALDAAQQDARFEALLAEDRSRGFDPSVAPLMRLHLADLGNQRHRFLWSYHHAILDGWSMPILLGEVFALYRSGAASLPPPPADFRHYLAWLRKQDMDEVRSFWRDALKGFRSPMRWAPSMAPAPGPAGEATVRRLATAHGSMDGVWLERAAALCRAQRITLNTLCQGAWALLLSLHGDADDVVHGMVVSGRSGGFAGAENMVGLFINTLPTRVRIDAELPLMDWLRRLQAGTQQAERLAHSPLAEVLACSELPRQQALFDSLYVFENYPGQAAFRSVVEACGLRVEDLRAVEETNYPLALIVLPGEGLQWQLTYDTARFSAAAVERLVGQYRGLLGRFVDGGDVPLHGIGLRASGPLVGEPCTPAIVPADSLAALLWRQASSAPRRLALAGSSGCIDQAALSERIERGLLRWAQLGYGPGDRVLLLSEDPACALVMLLSGLAHGIDCVLPDADRSLPELFGAAGAAWGHEGLQGCVRGDAGLRAPMGLRVDVFEQQAADLPSPATAPSDPSRGACSLISREDDGAWTLLRYTQAQLLHAADAFARRQPAGETRDLAVMHSPLRPANLWTVLLGLCAGLTVHTLMPSKDVHWLELLRTAGRRWHGVQLDAEATRALDRGAETTAPLAVDRWLVDAVSLSPCGARRLRELAPRAAVVRELRWPAHSLVHAASVVEDADAQPAAGASPVDGALPGTALQMIDRHQHPAAVDARGRLALGGSTVPDRLLRQGLPHHGACLAAADGAWLASDLPAWRDETGCHAELPHPPSALTRRPHWLQAMERDLSAEAGVAEAAVVERLSQRGEWQAAVFFAAAERESPGALKARLAARCAAHGAADAALVEVAALPRGPRAEVDRLALLRGEAPQLRRGTGAADEVPRDEIEAALHTIWCGLLKRERIGIEEDFFDLGGQSLLASVMLYQVEEKLAVPLDMETLLASPTIAALARAVRAGGSAAGGVPPDLAARAVLPEDIVPAGTWQARAPQEIFLTGATGFLGVHLLADLLQATPARVHCLVRAPDAAAGAQRLADALRSHGLWRAEHAARIVAVPGELDRPLLGLAEEAFAALAERIDAIYHNGAMVNFIYPYRSLERVNVLATQDVLRLACLHHAKPVHYVSTVGVLDRGAPAIPEVLDIALHDRLMGGYEQSKWVAEQLVCLAARRGLPVSIYRPSRIVGHSRTGRMNTDDLFCRLIKGIALFGKAPVDTGYDNMLPVDVASRAIVEASLNPEVHGHAVHVVNPEWNSMNALLDAIEARGHAIERLGYEPWLEQLARHVRQAPDHPLAMLIPVLRKLNPVADPTVGQRLPIAHDHLARWAPQALAQGLRPVQEWLAVYFAYFEASGYLPAPAASAVPVTRALPSVLVSEAEAEAG